MQRIAGVRPPGPWTAGLLSGAVHGLYVLSEGVTIAADTAGYEHYAARMIATGFDYPVLLAEANSSFPPLLYVVFVTLVAMLQLLFGGGWQTVMVALNFTAHLALAALVVRLAVRLTGSGPAGWAALLLFLGCFDLLMWVPVVCSDPTFVFLAFAIFTLAAARILDDAKGWRPVLGLAAIGIFYRPTGIVLVPDLLWAVYLAKAQAARLRRRSVPAALAVATVALVFAFAWFMQDPARWPFDAFARSFRDTAAGYAIGEVVSARPETYHAPPRQLVDFVLISADRFVHFFAIDAAAFSWGHTFVEAAFFLPCYALAAWLAFALWRGGTAFAPRERKVFLAALGAIFSYALFHALVQVDFDFRYRTPILAHLVLLAAGGIADIVRRAAR